MKDPVVLWSTFKNTVKSIVIVENGKAQWSNVNETQSKSSESEFMRHQKFSWKMSYYLMFECTKNKDFRVVF
jgi:hypothetical protein